MWWSYYGFKENPLDIRPNENLYGIEHVEKEVIDYIRSGNIFLLYGPTGCGKTSLAYKIMKNYNNEFNFIYLNGEENPNPDIFKILERHTYKKALFIKFKVKKPVVLILDEFYNFSENLSKQIKALYDNKIIYSIWLIQIQENIQNATISFLNRLSKKIYLDFPNEEIIIKVIESRLNGKIKFDNEFLLRIIRKNNRNIRSILIELNSILSKLKHPIKDIISERNIIEVKEKQEEEIKVSKQQLQILEILLGKKLTIKQISEILNIPYNTVSKQVSRLYRKGILMREDINKNVYYSINPKYLNTILKKIGK